MCSPIQKRGSPQVSVHCESLFFTTGDALESKFRRFLGAVNGVSSLPSSLFQGCQLKGRCWRIKKGIAKMAIPCEMDTNRHNIPILDTVPVTKIRLSLYQVERFIIIERRPALI